MKLAKADATAVQEAMANTRNGAGLSFSEFVQFWLRYDAAPALKNTRTRYPDLTEEELEWKMRLGWLSDGIIGWYLRGVAQRCSTDNLEEFAQFILMHVRQSVLSHNPEDSEYTEVWPLLQALAIQDQPTIDRYMKIATFPLKSGHADSVRIYNGVHSLLRSIGNDSPATFNRKPGKKPATWLDGILCCLEGISTRDPDKVASGIEEHLQGFRKSGRSSTLEKLISLEAHGLYRLAEQVDKDLVATVNTERALPWDREFHAWSTENRPTLTEKDFGKCPKPLAEAFVKLTQPKWA